MSMRDTSGERHWILCPRCGAKTRLQVFRETELKDFPLFCPKCRHESVISVRNFVTETDGLTAGGPICKRF